MRSLGDRAPCVFECVARRVRCQSTFSPDRRPPLASFAMLDVAAFFPANDCSGTVFGSTGASRAPVTGCPGTAVRAEITLQGRPSRKNSSGSVHSSMGVEYSGSERISSGTLSVQPPV